MVRTDEQVATELEMLYHEQFAGRKNQRFLISWSDLCALYGCKVFTRFRLKQLIAASSDRSLRVLDVQDGVAAVIPMGTVDRWRRVPRRVVQAHLPA